MQHFRLNAVVSGHHSALQCGRTRGSLVETEEVREGAEWRRVKQKKKGGKRGSDCVRQAVCLNIHLESITHTAMHFPLSHAITSPQRPLHVTFLCHFLPLSLSPPFPPSLTDPSVHLSNRALTSIWCDAASFFSRSRFIHRSLAPAFHLGTLLHTLTHSASHSQSSPCPEDHR